LGPFRLLDGTGKILRFPTEGVRVIRFIEQNCVFTNGAWVGQPFKLLPWQKQLILDLFELTWCDAHEQECRRYRTALIGVGKKNGKTELCAALALYFLIADGEPAPSIYCAAAGDYQADLVFNAAKTMVELSPTLRNVLEVYDREIVRPDMPNASIQRLPASGGRLDGQNVYIPICDELHEWMPGNQQKTFGMLRGGMAARSHPLHINITTAGVVDEDLVWEKYYNYGRQVESGEIDDPTFFFRWWMAPEGCDWKDLSFLPLANPSFGVTVQETFYKDEQSKRTESEFRRYYLNQPVLQVSEWLPQGAWDACAVPGLELIYDKKQTTYAGWDASTKYDSTAVVVVQLVDGKWRAKSWIWERPVDQDGTPKDDWEIPQAEVTELLRVMWRTNCKVIGIAFDPAFITWLAADLANEGLPMFEWPQSDSRMIPATQAAFEAITKKNLQHDGDPQFGRHVRSAKAKMQSRGGERLVKSQKRGSTKYVDAAIALLMALALGLKHEGPQQEWVPLGDGSGSAEGRTPEFRGIRKESF